MELEREKVDKVLELHFPEFLTIYDEVSLVLGELYRRVCKIEEKWKQQSVDIRIKNNTTRLIKTIEDISEIYGKYIKDRNIDKDNINFNISKNVAYMKDILVISEYIPVLVKQLREFFRINKIVITFHQIENLDTITFNEFTYGNKFFEVIYN